MREVLIREVLIEVGTQVLFEILMLIVGVVFAYLGKLISKSKQLEHIAVATDELEKVVKIVVGDLQQTVVDGLKEASKDGKLTEAEISELGKQLVQKVGEQISAPAAKTLYAAGIDVENMIHSIAEAYIARIKREEAYFIVGEAGEE